MKSPIDALSSSDTSSMAGIAYATARGSRYHSAHAFLLEKLVAFLEFAAHRHYVAAAIPVSFILGDVVRRVDHLRLVGSAPQSKVFSRRHPPVRVVRAGRGFA